MGRQVALGLLCPDAGQVCPTPSTSPQSCFSVPTGHLYPQPLWSKFSLSPYPGDTLLELALLLCRASCPHSPEESPCSGPWCSGGQSRGELDRAMPSRGPSSPSEQGGQWRGERQIWRWEGGQAWRGPLGTQKERQREKRGEGTEGEGTMTEPRQEGMRSGRYRHGAPAPARREERNAGGPSSARTGASGSSC